MFLTDNMFSTKITENDFFSSLERTMTKTASIEADLDNKKYNDINALLASAAKKLETIGLKKEAQVVVTLQEMNDPAVEGLDSETMLKNLEEKGWVFNAEDNEECSECSDGVEPQLTQEELKQIREMLK